MVKKTGYYIFEKKIISLDDPRCQGGVDATVFVAYFPLHQKPMAIKSAKDLKAEKRNIQLWVHHKVNLDKIKT